MKREFQATVTLDATELERAIGLEPAELEPGEIDRDPDLGFVVHYVLPAGRFQGEHRAAIITRVWQNASHPTAPGMSNLMVFQDQADDFLDGEHRLRWIGSVLYDPSGKPGTWHWSFDDQVIQASPPPA